ncbi:MAG: HAD-IA family hydrolase [Elusimicrobiota bacterium]|nr:HAD-IA family hydrolase [Elusimicrobiota bacterium]
MSAINIIFFDLDGTLADSRQDITDAVNRTREALGIEGKKTLSEVHSYVGGGLEETIRRALDKNSTKTSRENENLIKKALVLFRDFYRENPVTETKLYPLVEETLENLPGITKAVLTNKDRDIAISVLKGLGISGYFTDIIGGNDEKYRKPSPEGIKKIMNKYGFSADSALIVGDMDIDIITGRAAGIKTCGVTYGIGLKEDIIKAAPDYLIDSMAELKNIIAL